MRVRRHTLNGGFAGAPTALSARRASYHVAEAFNCEQNANRSSRTASSNNNKNNTYVARPVAALGVKNLFFISVIEAYNDCLRHKLSRPQAMEYMSLAADDLPKLAKEIWKNTYSPSTSTCFMVTFPKLREVFAAAFRDRIVHHWICLRFVPVFEDAAFRLGNPTHACRKGFGNQSAIRQVERAMYGISRGYQRQAWVYRGDIVSFFMSIDKKLLLSLALKLVNQNKHRWQKWEYDLLVRLLTVTVMHRPTKDCVINSPIELWTQIDPSKSMFYTDSSKSMPIGNLTTQILAGVYMMPFICHMYRLFSQRFGRHWFSEVSLTISVDDFVIVCSHRGVLRWLIRHAETFLLSELGLHCHSEKTYFQPVSHGVKFLGQWIKPHRRYIINRTVGRFADTVARADRLSQSSTLSTIAAESIRASLNSYLGILKGTRSSRIINKIFNSTSESFNRYFEFKNNKITLKLWKQSNSSSRMTTASDTDGSGQLHTPTGLVKNPTMQ